MSAGAGYSGKPLWQKLGLASGLGVRIIDPPTDYAVLTGFDTRTLASVGASDVAGFVHLFARDRARLESALPACLEHIAPGGSCWVSWPKKSSRMHRDLTEDGVREVALPLGWVDVKVCAIDADWSALKLLRRRR